MPKEVTFCRAVPDHIVEEDKLSARILIISKTSNSGSTDHQHMVEQPRLGDWNLSKENSYATHRYNAHSVRRISLVCRVCTTLCVSWLSETLNKRYLSLYCCRY